MNNSENNPSSFEEQLLYRESLQLAVLYEKLAAQRGFAFVNTGEWNIPMGFDGVHFTPEGHAAFAEGLFAALSEAESDLGK